jgi:hypothetical protein
MVDEARNANADLSHRSPQPTLQVEVLWHLRTRLHVARPTGYAL